MDFGAAITPKQETFYSESTEWQQPGAGQPPPAGGYQQPPGAVPPPYGYQQPPPYPQQPLWQGGFAPAIQTYMLPAILVTLFCFLPTGIAAIVFASQVSSKRNVGDYNGALHASKQARLWTIVGMNTGRHF